MQQQRSKVISQIENLLPVVSARYSVERLGVFGSVSRGEESQDSDVDVLVEFSGPATFDGFFGLKEFLESSLERRVDLVTRAALRDEILPSIEKDLFYVS